jgi:hypothetical protein
MSTHAPFDQKRNDEWAGPARQRHDLETMAALSDDPVVGLPAMVI